MNKQETKPYATATAFTARELLNADPIRRPTTVPTQTIEDDSTANPGIKSKRIERVTAASSADRIRHVKEMAKSTTKESDKETSAQVIVFAASSRPFGSP